MSVAVPLITAALPYIVPAVTYAIGHLVGWFHHKHSAAKRAATNK